MIKNNTTLKLYHWFIALLIYPICLYIFVGFGWLTFATITERGSFYGYTYHYYNLSLLQFSVYKGLVAICGLGYVLLLTIYLFKKDSFKLKKTFWYFLIFIVLLIICEIYLESRYIGKG
jgi:hypothetical protein